MRKLTKFGFLKTVAGYRNRTCAIGSMKFKTAIRDAVNDRLFWVRVTQPVPVDGNTLALRRVYDLRVKRSPLWYAQSAYKRRTRCSNSSEE
jgi:hypothetical protein